MGQCPNCGVNKESTLKSINALRQQLSEVKIVSDHNLKVYQEAAEGLRQQLADSQKHVTLLRDTLKVVVDKPKSHEAVRVATQALAATEPKP